MRKFQKNERKRRGGSLLFFVDNLLGVEFLILRRLAARGIRMASRKTSDCALLKFAKAEVVCIYWQFDRNLVVGISVT